MFGFLFVGHSSWPPGRGHPPGVFSWGVLREGGGGESVLGELSFFHAHARPVQMHYTAISAMQRNTLNAHEALLCDSLEIVPQQTLSVHY